MGLTMKQVAANRKFYAETGAKPYTRLNIWLCVWIPFISFLVVLGLNNDFSDIKLYIAPEYCCNNCQNSIQGKDCQGFDL